MSSGYMSRRSQFRIYRSGTPETYFIPTIEARPLPSKTERSPERVELECAAVEP